MRCWKRTGWGAVVAVVVCGALGGCGGGAAPRTGGGPAIAGGGGGSADQLLAILVNTSTPEDSRKAADRRLAEMQGKTDEARLAALEQILYAPGHSDAMRMYAMDQLADADPARAGKALILYLPRFEGAVLAHGCALAVKLGDVRVEGALIRSLSRGVDFSADGAKLKGRPEWDAIAKLSGQATEETLFEAVAKESDTSVQIAALDVLQAVAAPAKVIARIEKIQKMLAPGLPEELAEGWRADIEWWCRKFGVIPVGANESAWVHEMRDMNQADFFKRAVARHEQLRGQPDYVFAPRFVGVLAAVDDKTAHMTRAELLKQLSAKLATLKHVARRPSYEGAADDIDETLAANEKKLTRCDLLALHLLLVGLADPAVITELQKQGLADMSDTTTEHGGLLQLSPPPLPPPPPPDTTTENGSLEFKDYPVSTGPDTTANDFEYVTPYDLMHDTPKGIAQYHFHFQKVFNAERAGPSEGDLQYVRNNRCNGVVITSVGTRKMDVDYYTPAGAVVDLGVYEAPK